MHEQLCEVSPLTLRVGEWFPPFITLVEMLVSIIIEYGILSSMAGFSLPTFSFTQLEPDRNAL
jgi:hypothetical protein